MPASEQFAAELLFETRELKTGVREVSRALRDFEGETSKLFSQFSKAAEDNIQKVNQQLETLSNLEVGQKLQDFANAGTQTVKGFLDAAGQVEQFRLTLTTLTGSAAQAEIELKKLQDFAGSTPFKLDEVVSAGVTLRALGADVDRFLPLAGDLASVFNRDIRDSARALAKALSGSQDGIEILNDSFGITRRNLKEAGASFKTNGAIALDSAEDLKKLGNAIEKVAAQKNFTGAISEQLKSLQGNTSQLSDAAFKLASTIGESLIPAFIPLVQTATNFINTIAAAPAPVLALVGGATALATALAGGGAAFLTIKAAIAGLSPLITALPVAFTGTAAAATAAGTAATGATASFASMLGPIGLLVGLIGGGLLFAITQAEQESLKLGRAIDKQSEAISGTFSGFQRYRDAVAKATGASKEFVDIGQDTETIVRKIGQALDGVDGARFANEMAKLGINFDSLSRSTQRARENQKKFLAILNDVREERKRLEAQNRGLANSPLTAGYYDEQIEGLKKQETVLQRVIEKGKALVSSQREGTEKLGETEKAFKRIQAAAGKQLADLKIKADTDDLKRSNELLQETKGRIGQVKALLSNQGIDVSGLNAIQDALASTTDPNQKVALQGLLDLIKERAKLEKQSADISSKATKERVDAALEEARSRDTAPERLAALKAILATEKNLGDLKKRVNSEISREEKAIAGEQKQAQNERVNQALFEATQTESSTQQKIASLKRLLTQYELEGSTRRRILNDIARAEQELEKEREQRRKAEESALSSEYVRQQELVLQSIDERIEKLREEAEAGKSVDGEIQSALEERTAKEIELLKYKTKQRADAAESAKVAAQIEATGELEVESARRKGIDAIEDQQKAQDDRIKKIREERKEALKGISDEEKARDQAAQKSAQRQQASGGEDGKAQGPGQSLSELADELAAIFSPEAGRARAEEIREENRGADARRQASFADANPAVADRVLAEDERRRKRIADIDQKRQEAPAKAAQEREKKVAKLQDSANERALEASRFDAQGRNEAIAKFNEGGSDRRVLAAQAALETTKPIQVEPVATQAIQGTPLVTKAFSESSTRVATEAGTSAAKPSGPQEWIIGVRFEDQPNVSDIKEVKRPRGIDGGQSQLERTLNGFNLRVSI